MENTESCRQGDLVPSSTGRRLSKIGTGVFDLVLPIGSVPTDPAAEFRTSTIGSAFRGGQDTASTIGSLCPEKSPHLPCVADREMRSTSQLSRASKEAGSSKACEDPWSKATTCVPVGSSWDAVSGWLEDKELLSSLCEDAHDCWIPSALETSGTDECQVCSEGPCKGS